jgi:hypothetical protein
MTADEGLALRLTSFFEASALLRADRSGSGGIAGFLAELRAKLRSLPEAAKPAATPPLDAARLAAMLGRLEAPLANARAAGAFLDVWSVAGLGRNEVRNAAALAALWNPRPCPEVAIDFLNMFLRRLDRQGPLPSREQLEGGYHVQTEDCPMGDASDRVDLTLEGDGFLLGVEIKIDAPEGHEQIQRYRRVLNMKADASGKTASLVFLSPRPPSVSGTIHATWKDIAAAARQVALRSPAERRLPHQILAHYATRASTFR